MNLQEKLKYEFQNQMDKFHDDKIGLAVSGGGDSIAMLVLASEWATLNKKKIYVVTVNHNLRKEAKEEVNFTRRIYKKIRIFSFNFRLEKTYPSWKLTISSIISKGKTNKRLG